jgi:hypothetical protein
MWSISAAVSASFLSSIRSLMLSGLLYESPTTVVVMKTIVIWNEGTPT